MIALAEKVYQCPTKGGYVPCGAAGHWVTTVLAVAFGIIGVLAIVVTLWSWFKGPRR